MLEHGNNYLFKYMSQKLQSDKDILEFSYNKYMQGYTHYKTKKKMSHDINDVDSNDSLDWDLYWYIFYKINKDKFNDEVYNVASGQETSINTIADIIGGNKVKIPKRPGEPDRSLADISKIKAHFDWQPKITINEGIKMLLKNINEWKEAPVWTPGSSCRPRPRAFLPRRQRL